MDVFIQLSKFSALDINLENDILNFSTPFPESEFIFEDITENEYLQIQTLDSSQKDIPRKLVDQNMLDEDCLLEFSHDWNGENTELITEEQRLGSHV